MGEGLFSPWHIVIIAFVVFMVFGPKKIADRFTDISQGVQHLMDGDDEGAPSADAVVSNVAPPAPTKKPSRARRIGQWFYRRKTRKRRPTAP